MSVRVNNGLLLGALALTLVALFAYPLIPPKTFQVLPQVGLVTPSLDNYGDTTYNAARWLSQKDAHFACNIKAAGDKWADCTLNLFFGQLLDGANLSHFDTLVIDADFHGETDKLRVFFRNYDSAYARADDPNSSKFMSMELATTEFKQAEPVYIKMREFSVANWWLDQRPADRRLRPTEFNNIVTMGIDFSQFAVGTNYLEFNIKRIHFEGPMIAKSTWYLGILGLWLTGVSAFLTMQFIALIKRNRAYSARIDELASDRALLVRETQKYKYLSHVDPLTNVYNRAGFEKHLVRIADNPNTQPVAVVVIDIDHFKRINDQRGHDAGDAFLRTIAHLMGSNIRQEDVLARWGGEEFVLILPRSSAEAAYKLAEKMRTVISTHIFDAKKPLKVTCSFGITLLQPGEVFQDAFKRADNALYKAKRQGRNCTILADA